MPNSYRRFAVVIGAASLLAICFAVVPPIAQDPRYHHFADGRTLDGVPNFWNVVSNLPFLLAALWGLKALGSSGAFIRGWERIAYGALLAGTALVSVGSAYYHLRPDDARLVWDRLPMSVIFMSLVAATIGERVNMSAGRWLLLPLLLLGLGSVLDWRFSGDLRPYVLVQFGAMLAVPFLLARYPARYSHSGHVWCMVALYGLAKGAELLDHEIAAVIETGGHPWKHALAAAAIFFYVTGVARRQPVEMEAAPTVSPAVA